MSWIEVQFLQQALETLRECRLVLMHTFVMSSLFCFGSFGAHVHVRHVVSILFGAHAHVRRVVSILFCFGV
jgi:hypothetical protein